MTVDQKIVTGQTFAVSFTRDGVLVGPGSPAERAAQCLDNLRTLVEVHGFTISDVHQLKIYVVGPHPYLLDAWAPSPAGSPGWFLRPPWFA